jgi:CheY-like chemotaxis protein
MPAQSVSPPAFISYDNLRSFLPGKNVVPSQVDVPTIPEHLDPEKRRALIVDDVTDVTDMLSFLLSHADYDVVTANCARDALVEAQKQHFDVIISDIGMPEMNGYELVQALREIPGYQTTPIVAVTGYSMFNDQQKSLAAGFTAHMTKPIEPRVLLELIDQL